MESAGDNDYNTKGNPIGIYHGYWLFNPSRDVSVESVVKRRQSICGMQRNHIEFL